MTWQAKPVAYVEWVDAALVNGRWEDEQESLDEAAKVISQPIRSAGFLIADATDHVVLAAGRNANNDDAHGVFVIPRSAIKLLHVWDPKS